MAGLPEPQDIADYLGRGDDYDFVDLAGRHLPRMVAMVRSYTRGAGFNTGYDPVTDDLAAVIVSSCARLVTNPEALRSRSIDVAGDYAETLVHAYPAGLTLLEQAVLNRYRQRTA